jgi:hypothetical protein
MSVINFTNDDSGYLKWVGIHPSAYVVNSRMELDSTYLILHRANCKRITSYPKMLENPGGFTERSYSKYCSVSRPELTRFLARKTKSQNPFTKCCRTCNPN